MIWLIGIFIGLYTVFLLFAGSKWLLSKKLKSQVEEEKFISIIVPFRNEAKRIAPLLDSFKHLEYDPNQFEIILINDGSTDQSTEIIESLMGQNKVGNWSLMDLSADVKGSTKKAAISLGVSKAKGTIIFCTDADCVLPSQILNEINFKFSGDVKMCCGPVVYNSNGSIFQSIQQIELLALVGISKVSMDLGKPSMCNGANISFLKSAFEEVRGYEGVENIISGDDELLMHRFFIHFDGGVCFSDEPQMLVKTLPNGSVKELIQQRKRWASKWRYYTKLSPKLIAIAVFTLHLLICFGGLYSVFNQDFAFYFFTFLGLRLVSELFFIAAIARRLGQPVGYWSFLVSNLLYPPYAVFFGLMGTFGKFNWKGRTY